VSRISMPVSEVQITILEFSDSEWDLMVTQTG
jgi:hypothetical protein